MEFVRKILLCKACLVESFPAQIVRWRLSGCHLASPQWLSSCKPFMVVRQTSYLRSFQAFNRYGIDNFHGHGLKNLSRFFFWNMFKNVFQFLLPLHLFSSFPWYDNVPTATLPPTCTASKRRPIPTKKHCC